eukprot:551564_1
MLNTNYVSNGVMFIVECGKFIVSFILLITSEGIYQGIQLWRSTTFNEWFIFSLPAIIYAVINLQHMDPATVSVLSQCKIIVTSFLWWCVFKKHGHIILMVIIITAHKCILYGQWVKH